MTGPRTAVDHVRRSLVRIADLDGDLRSCILLRPEAVDEANSVDASSRHLPLAGWTVAVKDNMDVAGTVRTDGLGPPHRPPSATDSEAVRRLRRAGAVVVAKTNLEQLGFGATTQNPAWGACRNPWDRDRIPGGSSGGSAVAVAAGMVHAALGTDTGGSLRNPASFCGVSTLRPTHGLVPTAGVTPMSPSMDVVGPIAQRVADLRRLMVALTGEAGPREAVPLRGLAVGVPRGYFFDELDGAVAQGFDALVGVLRAGGARLAPVTLAGVAGAADAMAVLQNAEAASTLRAYWDDPRLGDGVRERMNVGRATTNAQLAAALRTARRWRRTVADTFAEVSVIVTPATPFVAPPIAPDDLITLSRRINRFTGCWSLLGTPALGLPLPPSGDGLPVGGQFIGPGGSDWRLLAIGEAIQTASAWHTQRPVSGP
ncbi:amidase [Dactylosporangium sp. CA-152071]|uniref:amidase n=1 Tax=Dactylosporangium sp. CA-152071 TaxID=3239933 RepID=UPI003D8E614F